MSKNRQNINRRDAIKTLTLGSSAMAISKLNSMTTKNKIKPLKGNIKQSVCRWCYGKMPFEDLAKEAKKIGLVGIDLIGAEGWDVLKKHDLISTMCYGDLEGKSTRSLTNGWCDERFHNDLIQNYTRHIKLVAGAGWKNLICFSGNRRGMSDEKGLENCIKGLSQIIPIAEDYGVILQMELLNSKVDHADYMCDNSNWGVTLCKALDSDHFKLLYDIYHMQIMEGDIIHTIRDNYKYYGHFHTAGVPGRNELDEKQELFYPPIMKAIMETGFNGYVAQEFIPRDKTNYGMDSLSKAVKLCDV
ncbi:MAG: hydroxypyruvate isomerase [Flavobacteriaceae bacterium]|jgi:hydroxypyruvate isomerase|nr:hydroxypyruvate isomerase [Flavobacteriaceae bacterium]